jgi:hypothetical protein
MHKALYDEETYKQKLIEEEEEEARKGPIPMGLGSDFPIPMRLYDAIPMNCEHKVLVNKIQEDFKSTNVFLERQFDSPKEQVEL